MKKNIWKGIATAAVPAAALILNFIADRLADKERDDKYVSREELDQLLKDKKESE